MDKTLSERTKDLKQSGIRSASMRCRQLNGINLGQGVCDMPTPDPIKQACTAAMQANRTTYSACEGIYPLREAIARKIKSFNHVEISPDSQVLVTHGATGAYVCIVTTLFNPGDEVIVFEPLYGYHRNILKLQGIETKGVDIDLKDFSIDWAGLEAAISKKTKGIVLCTPCNPIGKMFTRDELLRIGQIAKDNKLWVITDEMYEYITYPGYEHVSMASLEDFSDFTLTISGLSKTYNMTGWRLGYVSGPAPVIEKAALVQDLYYVCPATPLQHAALAAFAMPASYYETLREQYLQKRDYICNVLQKFGFKFKVPEGAYYLMADLANTPFKDDLEAVNSLLEKAKVAVVTGRSFYLDETRGQNMIRICYALDQTILEKAMEQMKNISWEVN